MSRPVESGRVCRCSSDLTNHIDNFVVGTSCVLCLPVFPGSSCAVSLPWRGKLAGGAPNLETYDQTWKILASHHVQEGSKPQNGEATKRENGVCNFTD